MLQSLPSQHLENIKYYWADAWLLASIGLANKKESGKLEDIFEAGDHLNHAIFTPEEIVGGLSRLTAGDYIYEKRKSEFFVTNKFQKLNLNIKNIDSVSKLADLLGAEPWHENEETPNQANSLKYPGITNKVLVEVLDRYLRNT